MELWIRSQSKERLIKCEEIDIYDRNQLNFIKSIDKDLDLKLEIMIIANNNINLGTYQTKERALEVLDEIQSKIKQQFIVKPSMLMTLEDIDREENKLIWKYDKEFIMQDNGFEIVPINDEVIVYEMPEK